MATPVDTAASGQAVASRWRRLPNILTLSRIAVIPPLVWLIALPDLWAAWTAGVVFLLASATDFADGFAARRLKVISHFGKLMDPIADKLMVAALLVALAAFGRLDAGWAVIPAIIILLREILISGVREYLAGLGAAGLPVTPLAKWKTAVQMAALTLAILGAPGAGGEIAALGGAAALWVAALLTVVTGWDYLRQAIDQLGRAQSDGPGSGDGNENVIGREGLGEREKR